LYYFVVAYDLKLVIITKYDIYFLSLYPHYKHILEILINIDIENVAIINDIKNNINMDFIFQLIILDNKKISLIVLIVGGADILIDIKINHQKFIFGIIVIIPLNSKIFRDEYLIYRSFTKRNRADEDSPWAIIIIIAPIIPM